MKLALKILILALTVLTITLLVPVVQGCNCQFDAHGMYVSPDGKVYRESVAERNFFSLMFSLLLLIATSILYARKAGS